MKLADALIEWEKAGDGAWLTVEGLCVFCNGDDRARHASAEIVYHRFIGNDWNVIPPKPKLVDLPEALMAASQGKRIRQMPNGQLLHRYGDGLLSDEGVYVTPTASRPWVKEWRILP